MELFNGKNVGVLKKVFNKIHYRVFQIMCIKDYEHIIRKYRGEQNILPVKVKAGDIYALFTDFPRK